MVFYTLPKIWQGRIKKYWDRTIPGDFPASKSKFDLKFDTQEEKDAVEKFEEELGTDESIVNELIPEGTFMSGYLNVYDVKGPRDEKVLLNPEKVTTNDPFIVLHYEDEEWKEIEDVELIQGYIWGTVPAKDEDPDAMTGSGGTIIDTGEEFSPIAVVFYKKDIEIAELDWFNGSLLVANGNPITVAADEEDNIIVTNQNSGTAVNLTDNSINLIVGGSVDGTDIDKTSIVASGISSNTLIIYAGSMFYDKDDPDKFTNVKEANVTVLDSVIKGITVGVGCVRTMKANIVVKNTEAFFVAGGQATISKLGKDANKSLEEISINSAQWTKDVSYEIDGSTITWLYTGGNSGYSYTINADMKATNTTIVGGIALGGSNGKSDVVNAYFENVLSPSYLSGNRGIVGSVNTKIKSSNITTITIFGDPEDKDVALIDSVSINVDDGTYGITIGKNGNLDVTDVSALNYFKISRAADYTISDEDLNILGEKFITK